MEKTQAPYKIKALEGTYAGAIFPLDREIVFGRNPGEASIVFPADTPGISRRHCSIKIVSGGMVQIKDLGSSEGTYFADGTKLEPNIGYQIHRGECFYLASKHEIYKII